MQVRATAGLVDDMVAPDATGAGGRIRVATETFCTVGSHVDVELNLGPNADEIVLSGIVCHVGTDPSAGDGPTGRPWPLLELEVLALHAQRLRYVLGVLSGERAATARAHPRVPVSLDGRWIHGISPRRFPVTEIGVGGVFVESLTSPLPGSRVDLQISFDPRLPPIYLRSDVVWVSTSVERPGFGAQFRLESDDTAKQLHALIQHAKASAD